MNVFAKFDEIPSMILEVIKETKRYRHTFVQSDWSFVRTDNVKTVYPPTNTVCGGYNYHFYSRKKLQNIGYACFHNDVIHRQYIHTKRYSAVGRQGNPNFPAASEVM